MGSWRDWLNSRRQRQRYAAGAGSAFSRDEDIFNLLNPLNPLSPLSPLHPANWPDGKPPDPLCINHAR